MPDRVELEGFILSSTTRVRAPEGTVWITITDDFEFFMGAGRAGSPINCLVEALGVVTRVALECSLFSDPDTLSRIAAELEGITHDRREDLRFEARSIPDALAKVIQKKVGEILEEQGNGIGRNAEDG